MDPYKTHTKLESIKGRSLHPVDLSFSRSNLSWANYVYLSQHIGVLLRNSISFADFSHFIANFDIGLNTLEPLDK
jgi:hypothetical protein